MRIWQLAVLIVGLALPNTAASNPVKKKNGIVDVPSNHSVDETVERVNNILQAKSITLFALIDHSGEAEKVGMTMRPTKLLIFGSPKVGTPLMLAAPMVSMKRRAIDWMGEDFSRPPLLNSRSDSPVVSVGLKSISSSSMNFVTDVVIPRCSMMRACTSQYFTEIRHA